MSQISIVASRSMVLTLLKAALPKQDYKKIKNNIPLDVEQMIVEYDQHRKHLRIHNGNDSLELTTKEDIKIRSRTLPTVIVRKNSIESDNLDGVFIGFV